MHTPAPLLFEHYISTLNIFQSLNLKIHGIIDYKTKLIRFRENQLGVNLKTSMRSLAMIHRICSTAIHTHIRKMNDEQNEYNLLVLCHWFRYVIQIIQFVLELIDDWLVRWEDVVRIVSMFAF